MPCTQSDIYLPRWTSKYPFQLPPNAPQATLFVSDAHFDLFFVTKLSNYHLAHSPSFPTVRARKLYSPTWCPHISKRQNVIDAQRPVPRPSGTRLHPAERHFQLLPSTWVCHNNTCAFRLTAGQQPPLWISICATMRSRNGMISYCFEQCCGVRHNHGV